MTKQELLELLKKARKQLKKYHVPDDEQTITLSIDTLEKALSEQPSIVSCKDCKDACIYDDDGVICTHVDSNGNDKHPADWFCADGVRRTE